jgi:hypothetical protein
MDFKDEVPGKRFLTAIFWFSRKNQSTRFLTPHHIINK